MLPTIALQDDVIVMVDQRKLPAQEVYVRCRTAPEVAKAIRTMVIRGAPAIGVIRAAVEQGKKIAVFADETRPFMQGARLTAWELVRDGINTTVITESMAGPLMRDGEIDIVIVGADRIAANGDTANKIGTYTVAVLAREHEIPFYVAAPLSTIDLATPDGKLIPIEQRDQREVTHFGTARLTPEGAKTRNPAFDVTPHRYIAGIITERGILRPPYSESLKQAFSQLAGA